VAQQISMVEKDMLCLAVCSMATLGQPKVLLVCHHQPGCILVHYI